MDVNGNQQLFGYPTHSSKYVLLFSIEENNS